VSLGADIFHPLYIYAHIHTYMKVQHPQCAAFTLGGTFAFYETVCASHLENTLRMHRLDYIYISKAPVEQKKNKIKTHYNGILLSLAVVEFFESVK